MYGLVYSWNIYRYKMVNNLYTRETMNSIKEEHKSRKYILDGLITKSIWIAPALCKRLSLHPQFFNALHRQGYKANAKITKTGGIYIVEIPKEVQKFINENYVSVKMNNNDIDDDFDYVFSITDNTKIGFYKGITNAEY